MTTANMTMRFNEQYGMLPTNIDRMLKRFNVSPADYNALAEAFGADWASMRAHVVSHSKTGMYRPPIGW